MKLKDTFRDRKYLERLLDGNTFEFEIGADALDSVPKVDGKLIEDCFEVIIEGNPNDSLLKISCWTNEEDEKGHLVSMTKTFKVKGKATLEILGEVETEDTDKAVIDDLKGKE